MEILEIMKARHSVRCYESRGIEQEKRQTLNRLIADINEKTGLHIQIIYDEPMCFSSSAGRYGSFSGVENYISLTGPKSAALDEQLGFFGEELVLKAQEMGLNTCWVAVTHGKSQAVVEQGEKELCLISVGYGQNSGVPHKSKAIDKVCNYTSGMPEWFLDGVNAALLAPTAVNQQKFYFELTGDTTVKLTSGLGFYAKLDMGIVKYHFEAVSGVKVS